MNLNLRKFLSNRTLIVFAVALVVLVAGALADGFIPESLHLNYLIGYFIGAVYTLLMVGTGDWRKGWNTGLPKGGPFTVPVQCNECGTLIENITVAVNHVMTTGHRGFHTYRKPEVSQ